MEIIYVSTSCFATCGNKLFIKPRGRWGKEKKKKKRNDTSQFVFSNETRDAPVETIHTSSSKRSCLIKELRLKQTEPLYITPVFNSNDIGQLYPI